MIRRSTEYGTALIEYTLTRSARRTLSISVHADGVSVVAPEGADVSTIDERVRRRARWILRQQRMFAGYKPKTPPRAFVGGETHRYLGRQYRLKIEPGSNDRCGFSRDGWWLRAAGRMIAHGQARFWGVDVPPRRRSS